MKIFSIFFLIAFFCICLSVKVKSDLEKNLDEETSSETEVLQESHFTYITPDLDLDTYYFYEHFDDEKQFVERWIKSEISKSNSKDEKYDGEWDYLNSHHKLKGDNCIMMNSKAKHHAISSKFVKKFEFKKNPLIVQYEVQFRNGQECGGAYIKLLSSPTNDLYRINDATPYTIMFGPDKCGTDEKLHFIFKHKNPINGTFREIHFKKSSTINKLNEIFKDLKWHIFRLIVRPDNTFEIQLDKKVVATGSLLEDFDPPVNPPKIIDDPNDKKPEDWDEREKIPDPDAKKPDDWDENQPRKLVDLNAIKPTDWLEDENEMIPDSQAKKPEDWDTNMDGEWEPPLINNPKCTKVSGCGKWKKPLIDNPKFKGKWKAQLIPNPDYKGKWTPKQIDNPEYYNDNFPFKMNSIDAVAFELWSISDKIAFDNILITDSVDVANYVLDHTYQTKKEIADAETDNWFVKIIKETNKKPWLWLIYVLAIAIPLLLFIGYCCVSFGKKIEHPSSDPKLNENDLKDELNENTEEKVKLRKNKIKRDD